MNALTSPPWPARPALFLDLDGTLVEFAGRPHEAAPSERLRELLPRLAPATGGAVAIVSGRAIAELDRLLAPHRFAAAGIHGLEHRNAACDEIRTPGDAGTLDPARKKLDALAEQHDGLLLEDKGFAVALHFRQRPDLAPAVAQAASELDAALPTSLEVLRGKMVLEIKLAGSNKGVAIRTFMHEPPYAGRTPVFIGDDVTDEAGFEAVNAMQGVSIKVGAGPSAAHWRLDDVAAVVAWLELAATASSEGERSTT